MTVDDIKGSINDYKEIKTDLNNLILKISESKFISDSPVKNSLSGISNLVDKNIESLKENLQNKKS